MNKWNQNDYQILKTLGSGAHGSVYLAQKKKEKLKLSRLFAIKEYDKRYLNLDDFSNEVEILSTLNHQNICHIYDAYETDLSFNILMEYIEGCTIREFLVEIGKKNIPFGIGEALQILDPIISALTYAHEQDAGLILHKDICTNNIMISKTGKVTLIDFGIGQFGDNENRILQGKPAFLPDSVISGKTHYSAATDFYSLGVVAYNLFTSHEIRNENEINLTNIKDKTSKEIVFLLLNFDGNYQKLNDMIEDALVENRGSLKKVCRKVFNRRFQGEKKLIPKNIIKYSILNFFGFLESFKDELNPNHTKVVRGNPPWGRRRITLVFIILTLAAYAIYMVKM